MPSARELKTLGFTSPVTPSLHEPVPTHRPPPALLYKQGNLQFHVERLLKRLRHKGHYQYLVKWREYHESENSWEFEAPLRQDCPFTVDVFERRAAGQLAPQGASDQ